MEVKTKLKFLILIPSFLFGFISCKNKETTEPACVGGPGGNLTIVAYLYHHDSLIVNKPNYRDTVYVKYNTKNLPGLNPSNYDAIFIGDSLENHVHVSGLKCGDYYLFGVGLDTISSPGFPFRVLGGIPFSTSSISGEVTLRIPVTE